MPETDEGVEAFAFDPDRLTEPGELAEAFIDGELITELMDAVDYDYLETLVEQLDSAIPSDVDQKEQEAAVEIADLILQRIEARGH